MGAVMDAAGIRGVMGRRAKGRWVVVVMQFLLGAVFSFVGPLVMTGLLWATVLLGLGLWWGWWRVFWWTTAVLLPLAFWTEWRTRGEFLSSSGGGALGVVGGWMMGALAATMGMSRRSVMSAYHSGNTVGLVELMLWGPRQVISAAYQARLMGGFVGMDLDPASEMLRKLLERGRSMTVQELGAGAERDEVVRAVGYLVYFDWAGVGESEEKVWALSAAKERLGAS